MPHKNIAIIILLLMVLGQIGTDVYLASFPAIQIALHTSSSLVQYTFSLFLAGFALSQLFYGPLSDCYGRKPFIIFGLTLFCTMGVWCAFGDNIVGLLIARFLQGVGAGACTVVARAMMRDMFDGKDLNKMNIYQSMVWSMVPISAPLLGSYIQHYLGWKYNFLLLTVLSGLLLLACWFKLPETIKVKEKTIGLKHIFLNYKEILSTTPFLFYLIFAACIISLFAVFNVSAPLIIQGLFNQSVIVYGWSVFSVAITFTIGSVVSRLLVHKLTTQNLMFIGLCTVILAGVSLFYISVKSQPQIYEFLMSIMIMQIGTAIAFPSVAAESMRPFKQNAGKAAAIFGCTLFLGSSIASGIMSSLQEKTLLPFSIVINLLITIMIAAYIMVAKHDANNTEGEY